jgi:putative peptidoglycan lipid II flippase
VLGTAFFVGEQCMEPAYLPVFARAFKKDGEARAWQFTSVLFNLQFFILLLIIVSMILFPTEMISLTTQWNKGELGDDAKAERMGMAVQMLPYIAPGLLGMSLASLTYGVLNGYKEFFFAAFGDAVLKLAILGGALLGSALGKSDWRFVAAGAVAGGTLKFFTHLLALGFKRLRNYRLSFNLSDEYLRDFFMLIVPLLAGIFLSRGRDVVMVNVLTSQEGLPTYFGMGRSIVDLFSFLVPYTLSIALLPFFCDISARDDRQHLGEVLTMIIRMLVWMFVPLCIVLSAAALPICLLAFRGKTIGPTEAGYAALVLKFFCIQLPFQAIEMMTMQAFFSSRRMIAPTVAGLAFSLIAPAIAYHLVINGKMTDSAQILTIVALCYVLSRVLKALVLVSLLKWTVPVLPAAQSIAYLGRLAIAGAGSAAAAWGAQLAVNGPLKGVIKALPGAPVRNAAEAIVIGAAGAAVYLALSLALRMEEPALCLQWTKEKLKRRKSKTQTPASV